MTDAPTAAPAPTAPAPAQAIAPSPIPRPRPDVKLLAKNHRLRSVGQFHNEHEVDLPEPFTIADALKDSFWANIAPRMKRGDIIHIWNEECTLYARLLVRAAPLPDHPQNWVKVRIIEVSEEKIEQIEQPGNFVVKWNVGARAYEVRRKSDNEVVSKAHPSREHAQEWIEKGMNAKAA